MANLPQMRATELYPLPCDPGVPTDNLDVNILAKAHSQHTDMCFQTLDSSVPEVLPYRSLSFSKLHSHDFNFSFIKKCMQIYFVFCNYLSSIRRLTSLRNAFIFFPINWTPFQSPPNITSIHWMCFYLCPWLSCLYGIKFELCWAEWRKVNFFSVSFDGSWTLGNCLYPTIFDLPKWKI